MRDATQQRSENLSSSQEVCLSNSSETVRDPSPSKPNKFQWFLRTENRPFLLGNQTNSTIFSELRTLNQTLPPCKPHNFNNFLRTENSEPDTFSLQIGQVSTLSQNQELWTRYFLLANRTPSNGVSEPQSSSLRTGQVSTGTRNSESGAPSLQNRTSFNSYSYS